jgi:hypothetical protein
VADLEVNHLLATTTGQGVPKVKPHPRLAQIDIQSRMMRADASHRTTIRGNMAVIRMISTTSLKIEDASGTEHQVHHNDF